MNDTFLITGGAGFVGSHMALGLKRSYPASRVVVFDNLMRRGSELNVPRMLREGIEFIHGDVRLPADITKVGGFDVLIDAAAEPSARAGYDGSVDYLIQTNLNGTLHALEACRKNKAMFILLSTSRVYPHQALNQLPYEITSSRFSGTIIFGNSVTSPEEASQVYLPHVTLTSFVEVE
jgi:CDP-paratose 2-epimerase